MELRGKLYTVLVTDIEAASFQISCDDLGITRAQAFRALVSALSGSEVSVIATTEGPQLVPGRNWATWEETG
jgi:hypothetical protein